MATEGDFVARRIGRIAFGSVLIAGFAVLAAPACWGAFLVFLAHSSREPHPAHAAQTVVVTWLVAAIVGSLASRIAARWPRPRPPEWLFTRSWTIPTVGIALLSPLTLHMLVVVPIGMLAHAPNAFDIWVYASIWITGITHLVYAVACARRVSQLARGLPARSMHSVLWITVAASCVPFVLLMGIPPGIVAVTALLLRPVQRAIAKRVEREHIELTVAALPRAIVRQPAEA